MRVVLFDCDGTLVDSQAMIVASMGSALAENDLPPLPRADILSIVGLSLPLAIARLIGPDNAERVPAVTEAYKRAFHGFRTGGEHLEPLFPGARATLDALAAHPDTLLGVVTGKSRRGLDAILALHGLAGHFAVTRTADDGPSKPHPFMTTDALDALGAAPSQAVVVGDTTFDMEMARAAGAGALAVTWGYHPAEALRQSGAQRLVDRFEDVPAAVDALLGGTGR